MKRIFQLTQQFGTWLSKNSVESESPLLLQSLEERVLYSAVPLPVENVDAPVEPTELDEVEFAEIQSNTAFIFSEDEAAPSPLPFAETAIDSSDQSSMQSADATLEDLEQLAESIDQTDSVSSENDERRTAAGLATATPSSASSNFYTFQEGQSFTINAEFLGAGSASYPAGFYLTSEPTAGQIYNNGQQVSSGDFIDRAAIDANEVVFVPDANFTGSIEFSIESDPAALNPIQDDFALLYEGVADDGIAVVGDTFAPVDSSAAVFEASTIDSEAHVEALSDGSYVVVASLGDSAGKLQFQRFNNKGIAIGGEVTVDSVHFRVDHVDVTSIDSGGFLIAFEGEDSGNRHLNIQRYDNNGQAVTFANGETQLTPAGNTTASDISILSLGEERFVVSYIRDGNSAIHSIVYNLDGTIEKQFIANAASAGTTNLSAQTTLLANGGYVLTWVEKSNAAGGESSIHAAIFDPGSHFQQQDIQLVAGTSIHDISIAATANDEFVIVWQSTPTDPTGIYAAHYDAMGNPLGFPMLIGHGTSAVDASPDIVALDDGSFVISHTAVDEDGSQEIIGQRFDQNLIATGSEFLINSFSAEDQTESEFALLSDGTLVATFKSGDQVSPATIFHQRLQMTAQGNEDSWISLDSVLAIDSTSTTEVIETISISGLPNGSKVTNGETDGSGSFIFQEVSPTNQTLIFNSTDVGQLSFMAPANVSGNIAATITMVTNDQGSVATSVANFQVAVASVVDAPTIGAATLATDEDTVITMTQAEFIANFISNEGLGPDDLVNSISNVAFSEANFENRVRQLPSSTSGITSSYIFDENQTLTAELPAVSETASFEFWIRAENLTGNDRVIAQFDDEDEGFTLVQMQDEIILQFKNDHSEIIELSAQGLIGQHRTGSYDQIVVTFTTTLGDSSKLDAALYLNGELAESITDIIGMDASDLLDSSNQLNLGQAKNGKGVGLTSPESFAGELGLFRFHDSLLDQDEVQQRFDAISNAPQITSINGTTIRPNAEVRFTSEENSIASSFTVSANGDFVFDPKEDFNQLKPGTSETIRLDVIVQSGSESYDTQTTINVTGLNDTPTQQFDEVTFNRNGGVGVASLDDFVKEVDGTTTNPTTEPTSIFLTTPQNGISVSSDSMGHRLTIDPSQFPSQDSVNFQISVVDGDSGQVEVYDMIANFVDDFTISGVVAHDSNIDGSIDGEAGFENAEVYLFRSTTGIFDLATAIYVDDTTTDSQGRFVFDQNLDFDATYFVVVDSLTVLLDSSDAGLTWAQQTFASQGAVYNDGSGLTITTEDGYLIGGRNSQTTDRFSNFSFLADSQHIISVTSSGDLTGLNELGFGFNFNVVNVLDNSNQLNHSNTEIDGQGTLNQFIHNANNIDGINRMIFLPTAAANVSNADGDQWWQIEVEELLPEIRDDLTIIDGTAYRTSENGLVRIDLNGGAVPGMLDGERLGVAGDRIGEADKFLNPISAPDLEIVRKALNDAGNPLPDLEYGIKVRGDLNNLDVQGVQIRGISIHGFGVNNATTMISTHSANIVIDGSDSDSSVFNVSNFQLEDNVIGARPDFTQFTAGHNKGNNLTIISAVGSLNQFDGLLGLSRLTNSIESNIFANADLRGIYITTGNQNDRDEDNSGYWLIANNQISSNGLSENTRGDGIEIGHSTNHVTIEGNYISDNFALGIDTYRSWGGNSIIGNTIENNRSQSGGPSVETGGVRIFGIGNEVYGNVIRNNAGAGVHVVGEYVGGFASNVAFNNHIHSNEFSNNDGLSIDNSRPLNPGGVRNDPNDYNLFVFSNGDGIDANDQLTDSTTGNFGIDAPEIESATFDGDLLSVRFSSNLSSGPNAKAVIQIYLSENGVTHGEGEVLLANIDFDELTLVNGFYVAEFYPSKDRLPVDLTQEININATISTELSTLGPDISGNLRIFTGFNTSEFSRSHLLDVNRAPTFATATLQTDVAEGTTSVVTLQANDLDGDHLTFSIVNGRDAALFDVDNNGLLTFLTPPNFENPTDIDGNNLYQVQINVSDDDGASSLIGVTVKVTDINEAPGFVGGTGFSVVEGQSFVGQASADDPDSDSIVYSLKTGVEDGALFEVEANGNIRFITPPDFENPSSLTGDNNYTLVVIADDQNGFRVERQFTVAVTDLDEAPIINAITATFVDEGDVFVQTVTATDFNGAAIETTLLDVADSHLFSIDVNGNISFINAPDFETPLDTNGNNIYEIAVQADDGNGNRSVETISITVAPVNERPFYVGNTQANLLSQDESSSRIFRLGSLFDDQEGDSLQLRIAGGQHANLFEIVNNRLSLKSVPEITGPDSPVYEVEIVASDGVNDSDKKTFNLTVNNINDAPVTDDRFYFATQDEHDSAAEFAIPDGNRFDADGDSTTLVITGNGADNDLFEVVDNKIKFKVPPVLVDGMDRTYNVTTAISDGQVNSRIVSFEITVENVNDRPEITNSLPVQNLEVDQIDAGASIDLNQISTIDRDNDSTMLRLDDNGQDNSLFEINDNNELVFIATPALNGGQDRTYTVGIVASDGELNSASTTISIVVKNRNDTPTFTSPVPVGPLQVQENQAAEIFNFEGFDPDGDNVSYTLLGDDRSFFEISENGQLTFSDNRPVFQPDGENLLKIEVQASDPLGASVRQTLQVAVTQDPNNTGVNINDGENNSPPPTPEELTETSETMLADGDAEPTNPSPITSPKPPKTDRQSTQAVVQRRADINGLVAVADLKISDDEVFFDLTSDSVTYLFQSSGQGPQLVTQEIGDIIENRRFAEEIELEKSILANYFWQGFDDSEDEFIRRNLDVDTTSIVAASAGLSLGLVSYLRLAAMATTVVTQLPAWKTLDVAPLISAFDEEEAETIHQIVDA